MEEPQSKVVKSVAPLRKVVPVPQYLETGKLPPQAVDLEEAVLGALMLEEEAVNDVIDILQPKSFYKETHQKIFEVIQILFQDSEPIDILTVTEKLKKRGDLDFVGGPYYISQLTSRVASSANAEYHARIIAQKYVQRELIRISSDTIKMAYDETTDIFDLLDKAESGLYSVTEGNLKKSWDPMHSLLKQAIERIEEMKDKAEGISGVPTGFAALDKVTAGFQPADMVILAARPGMGKTAFVLSMARNTAVEHGRPVAVFSLEMSSLQLTNRLISSETELDSEKLKKGNLADHEWQQLHSKINRLSDAPIYIDDTPALSVFEFRAKARRLKQKHNIEMIIIDYLQLMTVGGSKGVGNREQEISTISRSIKSIAKELNIPIIALSQLSRAVETRGGSKKPMLSDLRESGAIEQDADMVMFIYRPSYYNLDQDEDGNMIPEDYAEVHIAKHRNGSLDTVPLRFIGKFTKFMDRESSEFDSLAPIAPSDDFGFEDGSNNMIMPSSMNDDEGEVPF
ncbi:MAG: replicative DNA helicase [Flavobacteriales bacterium]|nr:replicative DNA helicase [Flavobacteriales bacterium]